MMPGVKEIERRDRERIKIGAVSAHILEVKVNGHVEITETRFWLRIEQKLGAKTPLELRRQLRARSSPASKTR
jgi:hypothetical protein